MERGRQGKQGRAFDDVDLAAVRPRALLAEGPERGPGGAPLGHVLEVEDDDGLVVRLVGADADALPAAVGGLDDVLRVCAHDELVNRGCSCAMKRKESA